MNYKHGKTHNNKCIDCGKHISFISKRCKSCGQKHRHKDDIVIINHCMYCGKLIDNYSKACQECYWINILSAKWSGSNNPNWIKNRELLIYPLEFNDVLKESIRKRDGYICQNPECNMTEEEHILTWDTELNVHHIDYNKKNCNEDNLITLCKQCNIRANYNRTYWRELYSNLIRIGRNIQ